MNTMDDLKELLIEMDCTPDHVGELVNAIRELSNGHRRLPVCMAFAVYLKFLIEQSDGDPKKELEIILDLANAYGVDLRPRETGDRKVKKLEL